MEKRRTLQGRELALLRASFSPVYPCQAAAGSEHAWESGPARPSGAKPPHAQTLPEHSPRQGQGQQGAIPELRSKVRMWIPACRHRGTPETGNGWLVPTWPPHLMVSQVGCLGTHPKRLLELLCIFVFLSFNFYFGVCFCRTQNMPG